MKTISLFSWNVNGIRAVERKGAMDWFLDEKPTILGLQEIKASRDQVPESLKDLGGYEDYFVSAERKGYSGVALYSQIKPKAVHYGLGIKEFDNEGRVVIAEYGKFTLLNVYFPNGKASKERLAFKMAFYDAFLEHINMRRERGEKIIFCGDVNTAHKEIDLARPKENEKVSGFLPEERAWIDRVIEAGYIDTLRLFNDQPEQYTWWDMKSRARERNVGWRIDYFFVSSNLKRKVKAAVIRPEIMGSDHCPVGIELAL